MEIGGGESREVEKKGAMVRGESVTTKIKPTSVRKTGLFSKMHAMNMKMKKEMEKEKEKEKEKGKGKEEEKAETESAKGANEQRPKEGGDATAGSGNSASKSPLLRVPSLSMSLRKASREQDEDEEERKKREERRRLFCSRLKAAPEESESRPKPVETGIKRFFRSNSSKSQPFPVCWTPNPSIHPSDKQTDGEPRRVFRNKQTNSQSIYFENITTNQAKGMSECTHSPP